MRMRALSAALLGSALLVWRQDVAAQDRHTFDTRIRPFLTRNCAGCHNAKLNTANLNLDAFADEASASKKPEVWQKVRDRLITGKMPPPPAPPLAKEEIAEVTKWIDGVLQSSGYVSDNPGRLVARRLNRVEYNNTLRDLLAVPIRPADEFPVDDSGYGFDNVGDVLTVSPMLMEKYLTAAERVSRLAIYGSALPDKPTRLARLLNRRSPDVNDVANSLYGVALPYSMRGAMYGAWVFPADAEYEFRLRIANFRGGDVVVNSSNGPGRGGRGAAAAPGQPGPAGRGGRGRGGRAPLTAEQIRAREEAARKAAPPRKLVLTVDGAPVITDVVEGTTTFGYDRGEFTGRMTLKAGAHNLRASFPELADLPDPRQNLNPDQRRALFVDYLDIVGPYHPSSEPPPSYRKVFVCDHDPGKHTEACARKTVESVMRRAYRRPVTPAEVEAKYKLVAVARKEGDSFDEGVRLALQAILVSPDFLFHLERDPKTAAGAHPVSNHEFASRLSYFLWASMPDEELSRLADQGHLRQPEVLAQQVRRMMADPKASNLVDNFAAQWLQLRNLGRTKPDPARFPTVDDELLDAMRQETSLFVQAVIQEDRSVMDFVDAPFTFVNGILAHHYGIPGVSGEAFQRVTLDGEKRGGLLTQGAILTVSSYPTRTSPPVRGKWVLENLLGSAPPPPPANVPVLNEADLGKTVSMRARMEQHRKDPSCAVCHNQLDPIGFGLESYDAVGAWRDKDGDVKIDTSGVLPDGKSFQGAKDLKQILRGQSAAFTRNLTEKMLTFALGRGLETFDRRVVEDIVRKMEQNQYRFSTLVLEIVNSRPFQMRSGESGGKG
jgi:Protein of unknown function (DUF1592)/Protein of unknown function (DUF1588)/Protein of unknown function (DUF1587)/Protein of unknown function (DUF1585)/Protein of unknown function (DUF1595)